MSDSASNNPKATVTALATGLESLSALIKNEALERVCFIISPAIALILSLCYRITTRYINFRTGLKQYKLIISDFEMEFANLNITPKRKIFLQSEIEKCWIKINELRIENIKIVTK